MFDLLEVLTLMPGFIQPYTLILASFRAGAIAQTAFVSG
jgi:hypothetical protein